MEPLVYLGFGLSALSAAKILEKVNNVDYVRDSKTLKKPDHEGIVLVGKKRRAWDFTRAWTHGDQYIARFFLQRNVRLKWKNRSDISDIVDAFKDPGFQSIAIVGHSSKDTRDYIYQHKRRVYSEELYWKTINAEKKEGYLFLACCGLANGEVFGEHRMKHRDRIYGWTAPYGTNHEEYTQLCA